LISCYFILFLLSSLSFAPIRSFCTLLKLENGKDTSSITQTTGTDNQIVSHQCLAGQAGRTLMLMLCVSSTPTVVSESKQVQGCQSFYPPFPPMSIPPAPLLALFTRPSRRLSLCRNFLIEQK
jgi:hypothetical protein